MCFESHHGLILMQLWMLALLTEVGKIVSVQYSSVAQSCRLFVTPWNAGCQAFLSITNSRNWLKLMSFELVMQSNHLILFRPLLLLPSISMHSNHLILFRPLLLLPSVFLSIRVFSSESVLHIRWPKDWCLSFSISPSNEFSELISLRVDWLDLLAVQEALKSLLQYHSSKASILRCSAFSIVQLSHPYVTTGKAIALMIWTLLAKWCLCFLICCLVWS